MNLNINESVSVTLTASGAATWNTNEDYFADKFKHLEWFGPKYKSEGDVLKEQLWHLFQVFGNSVSLGKEVPFKNCIITIGDNV